MADRTTSNRTRAGQYGQTGLASGAVNLETSRDPFEGTTTWHEYRTLWRDF